jgi:predicted ester cyclase
MAGMAPDVDCASQVPTLVRVPFTLNTLNPGGQMLDQTLPDHAALACEVMEAIDAADFGRTAGLLDDGFAMHYLGVPEPISKPVLLEMIRGYFGPFPDMRHEVLQTLTCGDYVTMRVTVHATHRDTYEGIAATGRQVAVGGIHVLRFADGKIVEWWAAEDDLGLLRQLGAIITAP